MDVIAADGVPVAFFDEGHGPAILILPPGLDDGGHYAPVARRLARRFRVIRLRRRSYRDDLPPGHQVTVAGELEDVKALAAAVEGPIVLVGHSSGGNLALQALAALPGRFAGAVLYEPVFVTDRPVLNPESYRAQCEAFSAGRLDRAMAIHMREHVGSSKLYSWWLGKFSAAVPSYRRLVRGMVVTDAAAIDAAGDRRSAYSTIRTPTLLLGGSLGAAWAKDGLDHLESRLANTSRATIPGQGHNANLFRPAKLSAIIAEYAQRCFPQTG